MAGCLAGRSNRAAQAGSPETFAFGIHPRAPFAEKLQRRLACGRRTGVAGNVHGPPSPFRRTRLTLFTPPRPHGRRAKAPPAAEMLCDRPRAASSRDRKAPGRWWPPSYRFSQITITNRLGIGRKVARDVCVMPVLQDSCGSRVSFIGFKRIRGFRLPFSQPCVWRIRFGLRAAKA